MICITDDKLADCFFKADCIINANDVKYAITKQKAGKSDGTCSLVGDHFFHAGNDFLFTCHNYGLA
jgi:hypothetical protein